jgi:hypothetical protein
MTQGHVEPLQWYIQQAARGHQPGAHSSLLGCKHASLAAAAADGTTGCVGLLRRLLQQLHEQQEQQTQHGQLLAVLCQHKQQHAPAGCQASSAADAHSRMSQLVTVLQDICVYLLDLSEQLAACRRDVWQQQQ